jgi:hypothetical protein
MLISGWMQAKAYKTIQSGNTCSYAVAAGRENVIQLEAFKNVKVNVEKHSVALDLHIQYGRKHEITYTDDLKEAISEKVSEDTLFLTVKNEKYSQFAVLVVNIPMLNSVSISSTHNSKELGCLVSISGFSGNNLTINNNGYNNLSLDNNKLHKLDLKGDFYKDGRIEISQYPDYDSIKVDIEGKNGTFVMGFRENARTKRNPKQWIDIRLPESFHVEADASVTSRISLKK